MKIQVLEEHRHPALSRLSIAAATPSFPGILNFQGPPAFTVGPRVRDIGSETWRGATNGHILSPSRAMHAPPLTCSGLTPCWGDRACGGRPASMGFMDDASTRSRLWNTCLRAHEVETVDEFSLDRWQSDGKLRA